MSRSTYEAVLPYYGCKRTLAPQIIEALGPHSVYWEPFCGSCAVLLAKPIARMEVVNDLHRALTNLLLVVQDDELAPRLFDRLLRTAFAEEIQQESAHCLREDSALSPLDWAYHYFVACWMGRNGLAGSRREPWVGFAKRYTSTGGDPALRFRQAVERLPAWWERLRAVTILSMDGVQLLDRIEDAPHVAIYCDPPYLDKHAGYQHDFVAEDHAKLAEPLGRFRRARVVVSYYDHPHLESLYPEAYWEKRRLDVPARLGGSRGDTAPEILFVSRQVG